MSLCRRCGAVFGCAMADRDAAGETGERQDAPCWCTLLPAVAPLSREAAAGCWCADCLRRFIAEAERGPAAIS